MTKITSSTPAPALLLLLGLSLMLPITCSLPRAGGGTSLPADAPTAYDVLDRYGLPKGILPEGVTSYLLREDGTFEVYLGGSGRCEFTLKAGYTLSYKRKVTGRLEETTPAVRELRGVSVRVLFLWVGISEVVGGDGELSFYVGPFSASFPISSFQESPRCGCGLDCDAAAGRVAALSDS